MLHRAAWTRPGFACPALSGVSTSWNGGYAVPEGASHGIDAETRRRLKRRMVAVQTCPVLTGAPSAARRLARVDKSSTAKASRHQSGQ
ncbi:hypothetical protein PLICRDRAFT_56225 [Plicaturopsis crispa FD-325 SS-3]|nr:hypothetical protein PLICRDRAFT_56225 [Plicaturopsis crispa FD-325 SS-3]